MAKPQIYATEKLKSAREEKGFTQKEMADLLSLEFNRGVSESTYQKWEQGTLNINPEQAVELSRYLKIDLSELVEKRENESQE